MTENEAIKVMESYSEEEYGKGLVAESHKIAIKALSEIQQYRAIGTVEDIRNTHLLCEVFSNTVRDYTTIGTIEEFKALKEKNEPKKPIEKVLPYSEEFGFNSEWKCPTCGAYVGYFSEGMSEPEQMEYCNECGQHIAKDWTET